MDKISFDFGNMLAPSIGQEQGIEASELEQLNGALASAHAAIEGYRRERVLGFLDLPYQSPEALKAIRHLADKTAGSFENFVVLGIGGSALGNIALHNSLRHPFHNLLPRKERGNRPRVFVADNVDPVALQGLLDVLDMRKTCFNVITKSGDTVETMAGYFLARDRMRKAVGKKKAAAHFIATTSAHKGALREIATEEGYATLEIPDNVGGRFSVLSPVGLLSAAVSGIDIAALCAGAKAMDKVCRASADTAKNPALFAAALHYLAYRKDKRIAVLIPYAQGLKEISDWFAQLWAESLGKKLDRSQKPVFVGPTPVKALGVTDQHSQLQLYQEGPFDKIVTFIAVDKFKTDIKIPAAFPKRDIAYLSGHSFAQLLHTEQKATELALTKAGRMNATIRLAEVTPKTIGMLLYFFQMQTAYAGELFNINAFDQPGVETGKQYAYGVLGRKGFEAKREEFRQAAGATSRSIINVG